MRRSRMTTSVSFTAPRRTNETVAESSRTLNEQPTSSTLHSPKSTRQTLRTSTPSAPTAVESTALHDARNLSKAVHPDTAVSGSDATNRKRPRHEEEWVSEASAGTAAPVTASAMGLQRTTSKVRLFASCSSAEVKTREVFYPPPVKSPVLEPQEAHRLPPHRSPVPLTPPSLPPPAAVPPSTSLPQTVVPMSAAIEKVASAGLMTTSTSVKSSGFTQDASAGASKNPVGAPYALPARHEQRPIGAVRDHHGACTTSPSPSRTPFRTTPTHSNLHAQESATTSFGQAPVLQSSNSNVLDYRVSSAHVNPNKKADAPSSKSVAAALFASTTRRETAATALLRGLPTSSSMVPSPSAAASLTPAPLPEGTHYFLQALEQMAQTEQQSASAARTPSPSHPRRVHRRSTSRSAQRRCSRSDDRSEMSGGGSRSTSRKLDADNEEVAGPTVMSARAALPGELDDEREEADLSFCPGPHDATLYPSRRGAAAEEMYISASQKVLQQLHQSVSPVLPPPTSSNVPSTRPLLSTFRRESEVPPTQTHEEAVAPSPVRCSAQQRQSLALGDSVWFTSSSQGRRGPSASTPPLLEASAVHRTASQTSAFSSSSQPLHPQSWRPSELQPPVCEDASQNEFVLTQHSPRSSSSSQTHSTPLGAGGRLTTTNSYVAQYTPRESSRYTHTQTTTSVLLDPEEYAGLQLDTGEPLALLSGSQEDLAQNPYYQRLVQDLYCAPPPPVVGLLPSDPVPPPPPPCAEEDGDEVSATRTETPSVPLFAVPSILHTGSGATTRRTMMAMSGSATKTVPETDRTANSPLPAETGVGEEEDKEVGALRPRLSGGDRARSSYGLPEEAAAFYFSARGIHALYPWQQHVLGLRTVRDQRRNLVYSLPTSGGKTLVAEVCLLRCVVRDRRSAMLVLPFIAIAEEKTAALAPLGKAFDFVVDGQYGTAGRLPPPPPRDTPFTPYLFVCTIEKANSILNYLLEEQRAEQELGLVVVDELHMLGEGSRGATLELFLSKLLLLNTVVERREQKRDPELHHTLPGEGDIKKDLHDEISTTCDAVLLSADELALQRLAQPTSCFPPSPSAAAAASPSPATPVGCQIVGMSATIPNLPALARWLRAECYESNFRPVELVQYCVVNGERWRDGLPPPPLPRPQVEEEEEEEVRVTFRTAAAAYERDGLWNSNAVKLRGSEVEQLFQLASEVPDASVLLFCATRQQCVTTAKSLALLLRQHQRTARGDLPHGKELPDEEGLKAASASLRAAEDEPGVEWPQLSNGLAAEWRSLFQVGVGYHHGGLLQEEREVMEKAFQQRRVRWLCCTSTLAAGVNLPARRVLFRTPYVGRDFLTASRYRQMSGRAGRAGLDAFGESFLLLTQRRDIERGKALLRAPPELCGTQLLEEFGALQRALVECIETGLVTDHPTMRCWGAQLMCHHAWGAWNHLFAHCVAALETHAAEHHEEGEQSTPPVSFAAPPSLTLSSPPAAPRSTSPVLDASTVPVSASSSLPPAGTSSSLEVLAESQQRLEKEAVTVLPDATVRGVVVAVLTAFLVSGEKVCSTAATSHSAAVPPLHEGPLDGAPTLSVEDSRLSELDVSAQQKSSEWRSRVVLQLVEKALNGLLQAGLVHWVESPPLGGEEAALPRIKVTPFGQSAVRSCFSVEEAIMVREEFHHLRCCGLILSDDLHLCYFLTPLREVSQECDWRRYRDLLSRLSDDRQRIACLVGLDERFVDQRAMGLRVATHASAVAEERRQRFIASRFFVALLLSDVLLETPAEELEVKYGVTRGQVQSLMRSASMFSSSMTSFCRVMEWFTLEAVLASFVKRLGFGAKPDIVPLMELKSLTAARARALWNAGFKDVQSIAECGSPEELVAKVKQGSGPDSMVTKFFHARQANRIIQEAVQVERQNRKTALEK